MSDDMSKIVAVLGNLIERFDAADQRMQRLERILLNQTNQLNKKDEDDKGFYNALAVSQNDVIKVVNVGNDAHKTTANRISQLGASSDAAESKALQLNAQLDLWTKDISIKLTHMQGDITKIKLATTRRRSFFS